MSLPKPNRPGTGNIYGADPDRPFSVQSGRGQQAPPAVFWPHSQSQPVQARLAIAPVAQCGPQAPPPVFWPHPQPRPVQAKLAPPSLARCNSRRATPFVGAIARSPQQEAATPPRAAGCAQGSIPIAAHVEANTSLRLRPGLVQLMKDEISIEVAQGSDQVEAQLKDLCEILRELSTVSSSNSQKIGLLQAKAFSIWNDLPQRLKKQLEKIDTGAFGKSAAKAVEILFNGSATCHENNAKIALGGLLRYMKSIGLDSPEPKKPSETSPLILLEGSDNSEDVSPRRGGWCCQQ